MKIWVVLPAYNEELALPPLVKGLVSNLEKVQRPFSIVIVNDGSADRTIEVAHNLAKNAPVILLDNVTNKGLAETVKRGLFETANMASPDDIIITMDADNTHPAGLLPRMIQLIAEGFDVVIASRYQKGSRIRGLSLSRKVLSLGAAILFRVFFPIQGVRDYTCGFRAYRVGALKRLIDQYGRDFITERGFACMVELLLRLRQRQFLFVEVPMVLRYDFKPTQSNMKVMKTVVETLKLLVNRRFKKAQSPNSVTAHSGV